MNDADHYVQAISDFCAALAACETRSDVRAVLIGSWRDLGYTFEQCADMLADFDFR